MSQADELGVWHLGHLSAISTPRYRIAVMLHVSHSYHPVIAVNQSPASSEWPLCLDRLTMSCSVGD